MQQVSLCHVGVDKLEKVLLDLTCSLICGISFQHAAANVFLKIFSSFVCVLCICLLQRIEIHSIVNSEPICLIKGSFLFGLQKVSNVHVLGKQGVGSNEDPFLAL